ncbi:MAG: RNA-binding S4 domain-containing protein [Flavobacteriaceae bacterium]|nr:RNA-binding S4 domain-containing protein [Bacteroidia bacterium]NNK87621.1 RNA-binding S4 domain-containing protein [Flavobacteriaceae bacterium]
MRVDKYLWCIRFYKTRSLATKACKKGHIRVNGETAKPSRDVYTTDVLEIRRNQVNYKIEVLDIPPSRVGAKIVDLFRKDITPSKEFELVELIKLHKETQRSRGTGRPTKKDRREMDDFYDQNE